MGEKERVFILQCYNRCNGKEWKDVLIFCKARIADAGLPEHVVQLYLDCTESRVITRMQNVIRRALKTSPSPMNSKAIAESSIAQQNLMKYAEKKTPGQRKEDAIRNKLRDDFVGPSSDNDSGTEPSSKKKRKLDQAGATHMAHQKMCEKAMETMDKVNCLLEKVDKDLQKKYTK